MKKREGSFGFRLKAYFSHLTRPHRKDQLRVVIFAQGRSGSTLLESLLCSTPYFRKGGELLGDAGTTVRYPFAFISGLAKENTKNFIFHLKIYHLTTDRSKPIEPGPFLAQLVEDGWKIIYLKRRNKLNQVLSYQIRQVRGKAQKYDEENEEFRLAIHPHSLKEGIERRFSYEKAEKKALRNLPHHEVIYERDLEDTDKHQRTVDGILSFLDLAPVPVSTRLKKINSKHPREYLESYFRIKKMLIANGWEKFIKQRNRNKTRKARES